MTTTLARPRRPPLLVSPENGGTRVALAGTLDAEVAPALRDVIETLVAEAATVVVDASALERLDGSGLGALVSLRKRLAAAGGRLSVVGLHGQPLELLQRLGLKRVFAPR